VASTAILRDQTLSEQIQSLNARMEKLAVAGEWLEIYDILPRRNAMLLELDETELAPALLAARRSTDRIESMAIKAQHMVGKKITDLARGKKATDSYRSHA
jgi:hypothetical protein